MPPIPDDMLAALGALDPYQAARLRRMLTTLGEERTRQVVADAQAIQAAGGMHKPSGEPRSPMGIVGVLVRATACPADQAAIFGHDSVVPLDAALLTAALPIAEQLGAMTYPQQQTLATMHAVLGTDRLQAMLQAAQARAATGDYVTRSGAQLRSVRAILWRVVTEQTTREEAAAIFGTLPSSPRRGRLPSMRERWEAVCDRLGETSLTVRVHIRIVSRLVGMDTIEAVATEAEAIEANGGMWLPDGSRKRTLGGIFFQLLRERLTPEQAAQLPSRYGRASRAEAPPPLPATAPAAEEEPALPALVWAERRAIYQELGQEIGEGKVKVALVGRPGRVVEKPAVVITALTIHKMPALPRGVPAPPPTVYTVYLAVGQWTKVKDAIQDPEDVLIIEGVAGYDPDMEGIVVSATAVTTRGLQKAQKAAVGPSAAK